MAFSLWSWAAGLAGLLAALVGLYYASKLNKIVKGGLIGSSIGYAIFGFVILGVTALFEELVGFVKPFIPYSADDLLVASELLRLLAMVFFAQYFYRLYRGFAGYARQDD